VELEALDGQRQSWKLDALAPNAVIVLDLAGWAGKTIRSVRLSAAAGPASAAIESAKLLPASSPRRD
jgi:hypothetical protein